MLNSVLQERKYVVEKDSQYATQIEVIRGTINSADTGETIGPVDTEVSVTYTVTAQSAQQNQDFLLDDGVVVFSSGDITKNISVLVSTCSVMLAVFKNFTMMDAAYYLFHVDSN